MQINNNIQNSNMSFCAALNINIGRQTTSIVKNFEQITKDFPQDIINVKDNIIESAVFNNDVRIMAKDCINDFEEYKDSEILNKLVKLHEVYRKGSNLFSDVMNFCTDKLKQYRIVDDNYGIGERPQNGVWENLIWNTRILLREYCKNDIDEKSALCERQPQNVKIYYKDKLVYSGF